MQIDLTKIAGKAKRAWWYYPVTGEYTYIGECKNRVVEFVPPISGVGSDIVLVVVDTAASYLQAPTRAEGQSKGVLRSKPSGSAYSCLEAEAALESVGLGVAGRGVALMVDDAWAHLYAEVIRDIKI